jgi:hypothetical protein
VLIKTGVLKPFFSRKIHFDNSEQVFIYPFFFLDAVVKPCKIDALGQKQEK